MLKKSKYFGLMTSFLSLNATFHTLNYFINKASKEFDYFYIINVDYIVLFNKNNYEYNFSDEINNRPKNIILINPKNKSEFIGFMKNKDFLIINNFSRDFFSIKIHWLLNKLQVLQIQISNIGNVQGTRILDYSYILKAIKVIFCIDIFRKLIPILSFFKIISKIEIRFLSNLEILSSIKNNPIKKFFYDKKLFYAKEIIPINSRINDVFLDNNFKITNEFIVHIDHYLNYNHETLIRGHLSYDKIRTHVHKMEKCLLNLSLNLKKEVIVCIHPLYPLEEFQQYYKNFKILKYHTRHYICKAEVVTFWDSSSIVDAIFLKKRIISLHDQELSKNEITHSEIYKKKIDLIKLNINHPESFSDKMILNKLDLKIPNYKNYIDKYHCLEEGVNGTDKIIKIIKKKFF